MFEELAILKKKLDSYRPLDSNKMAAIGEKLRIEWTYNNNAIEGNTLSLSETAFFLREGLTSKGKPLSEYLETRNHAEAQEYYQALDMADKKDYTLIIEMIEREVTRTITLMLNVIEGRDAFSKEDLKRRLGIFEERIEKLDKDPIGKAVDEEKRRHCRERIYQFLEKLTKEMVEENKSEMVRFGVEDYLEQTSSYPLLTAAQEAQHYIKRYMSSVLQNIAQYLNSRNIIITEKTRKAEETSILQLNLISQRKYIPQGILTFVILPTRFTIIIVFTINISGLEKDEEIFDTTQQVIDYIQGSVLWEDWDKKTLEDFFVKAFTEFLKQIELEIEKRRLREKRI